LSFKHVPDTLREQIALPQPQRFIFRRPGMDWKSLNFCKFSGEADTLALGHFERHCLKSSVNDSFKNESLEGVYQHCIRNNNLIIALSAKLSANQMSLCPHNPLIIYKIAILTEYIYKYRDGLKIKKLPVLHIKTLYSLFMQVWLHTWKRNYIYSQVTCVLKWYK
jgi:hypothetical protein